MISKEDFEKGYAERSKMTVEGLRVLGLIACPCDCEEEGCEGWAMVHKDNLEDHFRLYVNKDRLVAMQKEPD